MVAAAIDPDLDAQLRAAFARQTFMTTLGARLVRLEPGLATVSYRREETLLQQNGYLHAGVATAAVDSACGFAAKSLAPAGHDVLTIEFKANFLRPASGISFEAVGRVIKPGRSIMVCEGQVFDRDGDERLVATLSATMFVYRAEA